MSPRQGSSLRLGAWLRLMLCVNAQNTTGNTTGNNFVGWETGLRIRGTLSLFFELSSRLCLRK